MSDVYAALVAAVLKVRGGGKKKTARARALKEKHDPDPWPHLFFLSSVANAKKELLAGFSPARTHAHTLSPSPLCTTANITCNVYKPDQFHETPSGSGKVFLA
jgi:hypothetical protein